MKDIDEDVKREGLGEDYPKPILIEDLGMLYPTEKSKQKTKYGLYKCGFCGTDFKANVYDIKNENTKSCGCYQKRRASETHKIHGLVRTRLHRIWCQIRGRVFNKTHKQYVDYGGRGITICDEWKNDFMSFHDWAMSNGYSEELSIDRIDNDGGYCPENCRWVGDTIQARNQRIPKNNKTGFKGVSFVKSKNKYVTYICINYKNKGLGHFSTAVEGAIAYNNYIIENNLEGFILNEIPEGYENDKNLSEK